jgi:hypothetical protein
MTMPLKIRPALALTATALTVGLGAFAAAPAQAQSTAPLTPIAGHAAVSAPSALTLHADADILCDDIDSRGKDLGLCSPGTFHDGGDPYRWPVTYIWVYAANRVWFHQNEDGSGWSYCFSGGYEGSVPAAYQDPGNIFISTNTAAC